MATPSDHDCLGLVLVFHDEEFSTAGNAGACLLRLQLLHHKTDTSVIRLSFLCPDATTEKLTEIVFLFGYQLVAVHRFGGGQFVNSCGGLTS